MSKETPIHMAWRSMRERCTNKLHKHWGHYGGRGISICKRWETFENFANDMGERPSLKHSLDRFPNPDGNYEPSNCRWATSKQQNNNRTNNRLIRIQGILRTMAEWCEVSGVNTRTASSRIRDGWNPIDAVTQAAGKSGRRGERHPRCKLTVELVREIRKRFASGESHKKIAQQFGIAGSTAWSIVSRRTWKEVS